jgi:hypothetical protein
MVSSQLRLDLPSDLFLSSLQSKMLYTYVFLIPASCPDHLILTDLITLITFGAEYRWWTSPLRGSLQPSVTYFLLGLNVIFEWPSTPITWNKLTEGAVWFYKSPMMSLIKGTRYSLSLTK